MLKTGIGNIHTSKIQVCMYVCAPGKRTYVKIRGMYVPIGNIHTSSKLQVCMYVWVRSDALTIS